MKMWQRILLEHNPDAKILADGKVYFPNAVHCTNTDIWYDHCISRIPEGFRVDETKHNESEIINTMYEDDLYEYLGY